MSQREIGGGNATMNMNLTHREIGNVHLKDQKYKLAIESYRKVLKKKKSRGSGYFRAVCQSNTSASYFELGDYRKAIEHAEKAIEAFDQAKQPDDESESILVLQLKNKLRIARAHFYSREFAICIAQQQEYQAFQPLVDAATFYQTLQPTDVKKPIISRPNLLFPVYEYSVFGTDDAASLLTGSADEPQGDARIELDRLEPRERQNLAILCAGCNESRHLFATLIDFHQQIAKNDDGHLTLVMNDVLPTALARSLLLCVLFYKIGREDGDHQMISSLISYTFAGVFLPRCMHNQLQKVLLELLELTTSSESLQQHYPLLQIDDTTLAGIHQVFCFWIEQGPGFPTFDKRYAMYKAELCKLPEMYIEQARQRRINQVNSNTTWTGAQKEKRTQKLREMSIEDFTRKYEYGTKLKAPMVYHLAAERAKILVPPMSILETFATDDSDVREFLQVIRNADVPSRELVERVYRVNPTGVDQNAQRADLTFSEFHIISTLCQVLPLDYYTSEQTIKPDLFDYTALYYRKVGQAMVGCETSVNVVLKAGEVHHIVKESDQTYDRIEISSIPDYAGIMQSFTHLMPALRRPTATLPTYLEHKVVMNLSMWLNATEYICSSTRLPSLKRLEQFMGIQFYSGLLWGRMQWTWSDANVAFPRYMELKHWLHSLFLSIVCPAQRKSQPMREESPLTLGTFFNVCDYLIQQRNCPPHWITRILDEMVSKSPLRTNATYPGTNNTENTKTVNLDIHQLDLRTHLLIWQSSSSSPPPLIEMPRLCPSGLRKYMFRDKICGRRALAKGCSVVNCLGVLLKNPDYISDEDEEHDSLWDTLGISTISGECSLRSELLCNRTDGKYHLLSAVEWEQDFSQWQSSDDDWADHLTQELRFWMHQDDFHRFRQYHVKLLRTDLWIQVPSSISMILEQAVVAVTE